MKEKNITKQQLSILMANALIHFDNALYGYLVPILAPLFFPKSNHVAQLIWGYMPFVASFLAKPLGLFFFSKMAQNGKEIVALRYTLLGIGSSLLALGSLPTYETASLWTISWLLLARICGEACAAGEHTIAKIYLIKGITTQPAKKLAAWYEGSSMVGILGAGAASSCLAWLPHPHLYWRIPFLTAAAATLFNVVFFRLKHTKISEHHQPITQKSSPFLEFWQARTPIMRIAIVAGFGYMAYTIPFLFISSFVPIVTTITYSAMMQYLPIFMLLDIACIGWIAKVGQKADHNNVMAVASGLIALSIIPLFAGLPGASFFYVTMVRCWLIFLGVVFSCFLAIWSKEQVTESSPYLTIGLATVLGTSLLGKSAPALCFYLFHTYNSPIAPACYIALLAFAATLIMADSASP